MSQWSQENKVPHPRLRASLQGRLRKMLRTVRRQNQGSVKKKMDANGSWMEGDQRGKDGNYPRKIAPEARKAVADFMLSHSATKSHYRRARTRKRYFEPHISIHNMWTDF